MRAFRSAMVILGTAAVAALAAVGLRRRHDAAALADEARLLGTGGPTPPFDPRELDDLPAPARRYLARAIAPGTRRTRALRLAFRGRMRLAPDARWRPLWARETLAPGVGYVWRAVVGSGAGWYTLLDRYVAGHGEARLWGWGVVPVAQGTGADVDRSAAGRLACEALWVPSTLLPSAGCRWTAEDDDTATAHLTIDGVEAALRMTVDADGRLIRMRAARWRPDGEQSRWGTFGVDTITEEKTFAGYTVPSRLRAGWDLDGRDAFAFLQLDLVSAEHT